MRRLPLLVLSSALLLHVAVVTPAQKSPRPPAVTLPAKHGGTILVEHNAEDGTTTVRLEAMLLLVEYAAAKSQLSLAASFKQSERAPTPEFVNLILFSHSPKCRFPPQTSLHLLLDGAPLELKFQPDSSTTATLTTMETVTVYVPKAEGVLWVQREIEESGVCTESLAATVTPRTLAKLAGSKSAAAKVGTTTFKLPAHTLAALRDLAGRINSKQ